MTDEDALVAGVVAHPSDRLRKLVYADYLDERDDPRGELVRVEDSLLDLPPAADEFWERKAHRNQLRASAPADWLEKMGYGVIVHPVFAHGWPDDWRVRWRVLREFAERWYGVTLPDVGRRRREIAEAEARIGRTLPGSVREFVAFMRDMATVGDNAIWSHEELIESMPERGAVAFTERAEGDIAYVVETRDCDSNDDPPVYHHFYRTDPYENSYSFVSDSVSNFAISLLFDEAPNTYHRRVEPDQVGQVTEELRRAFPPPVPVGRWSVAEVAGACFACLTAESDLASHGLTLRLADPALNEMRHLVANMHPGHTTWRRTRDGKECPCSYCVARLMRDTPPT